MDLRNIHPLWILGAGLACWMAAEIFQLRAGAVFNLPYLAAIGLLAFAIEQTFRDLVSEPPVFEKATPIFFASVIVLVLVLLRLADLHLRPFANLLS